jgi:hypothetical protein
MLNRFLVHLFYPVLLITLFFGLRPKGFDFKNNVQWLADSAGIAFGKYGIAYTEPFLEWENNGTLAIEMVIHPKPSGEKEFSHILVIHNGDDSSQLVVGQWADSIVVMHGDDYENKLHQPRIVFSINKFSADENRVVLSSDPDGTKAFCNGQPVFKKAGFGLTLPAGGGRSRIIVGNCPYGRHPWQGVIKRLTVYRGGVSTASAENTLAWYRFDEKAGDRAIDHSGQKADLHIPVRMEPLKRFFLQVKIDWNDLDGETIADFAINFLGFIPFGWVLCARLGRTWPRLAVYRILIVVLAGFLLSLSIETAQAWLPSRSSDLFDLGLNTLGAWVGAVGERNRLQGKEAVGV